jgi:hypothetical protein
MNEYSDGLATGLALQNGNNCNNGFGCGGDWAWVVILAALFGGFGFGGFGFGGFGGGYGGAYGIQADLQRGFDNQSVLNKLNGLESGLCDGFYAQNTNMLNGFAGVQNTLTQGFAGVNNGITVNGYETRNALCDLGYRLQDCCCTTQRAIDGINFNTTKGFCDLGNVIHSTTRDIIDNANANSRAILDFMVQDKLATKDARIAQLENRVSQSEQNATLMAAMDANKAEILRRTGAECPSPAYLVNAPTPVNFPVNACGTVQFGGHCSPCGC